MEFLDKNGLQHMLEGLKPYLSQNPPKPTTPDWLAGPWESGYVKNRTHYMSITSVAEVFLQSGTIEFEVSTEPDKDLYFIPADFTIPVKVEANAMLSVEYGPSLYIKNVVYTGGSYIITLHHSVAVGQFVRFSNLDFATLDSNFIPDTIARKSELTELSAEVGKKVDADFVNNAIADAITTTLNEEV